MSLVYTTDTTTPCPTWTAAPRSAYGGTYAGTFEVVYPEPDEYDGTGNMCGAIGRPHVRMRSEVMTASGMNFWKDFFNKATDSHASIRLSAFDPRRNWWGFYIGHLKWPTWSRIAWVSASQDSLFSSVEIRLTECTVSPNTRFWTVGKTHVGDLTDIVR